MNQRKKGARGENQAMAFLKEWTNGMEFHRTPASGGLRWKKTDNIAGDIICGEPNYIFPFCVEIKFYADLRFDQLLLEPTSQKQKEIFGQLNIFWEQAKADAIRSKKIPLLMMRYNNLPSNFFFVALDKQDAIFLKKAKTFKLEKWLLSSNGLIFTNSNELLKNDFKRLEKSVKLLIKRRYD